jgi:TM2 domain-containing membrane protein YozV
LRAEDMNEHFNVSEKRILPTFLLFLVLSWPLGAHRFFLKRYASAILFIITIGGFGIWWIIDFILIVTGSMKDDRGQVVKIWVD